MVRKHLPLLERFFRRIGQPLTLHQHETFMPDTMMLDKPKSNGLRFQAGVRQATRSIVAVRRQTYRTKKLNHLRKFDMTKRNIDGHFNANPV